MSQGTGYLPFVDGLSEDVGAVYRNRVDYLIEQEIAKNGTASELHPEVEKILERCQTERSAKKRLRNSVESYEDDRKTFKIDMTRYAVDSTYTNQLAVSHSYLDHQLITLEQLLPKTQLNQWIVNNDYEQRLLQQAGKDINTQLRQLKQLHQYREAVQLQNSKR